MAIENETIVLVCSKLSDIWLFSAWFNSWPYNEKKKLPQRSSSNPARFVGLAIHTNIIACCLCKFRCSACPSV